MKDGLQLTETAESYKTEIERLEKELEKLREINETLVKSEEKYRTIFENTGTATIVIEDDTTISMVNTEFVNLSGFSKEEIEGKLKWTDLIEEGDLDRMKAYHAKRRDTPGRVPRNYECRPRNKWRDEKTAMMTVALIPGTRQSVASIRDITERRRAEAEILRISEAERRKIGSDLHDDLGQHLVGIEALSTLLKQKLAAENHPQAERAAEIASLIREATGKTRNLAKGLCPVNMEEGGLVSSLADFAAQVGKPFGAECRFNCLTSFNITNNAVATNLYHIAQEAVNNALRHGKADRVKITLFSMEDHICLVIADNGCGMDTLEKTEGLGLSIMGYRAKKIRGELHVKSRKGKGTRVICRINREYLS
jgi:PAS domain S-box-containing protein